MIFTDGSSIPENGTASASIFSQSTSEACCIGDHYEAFSFKAEVFAVKMGLDIVINKFYNPQDQFKNSNKHLNFFIDNQATILSISRPPKPTSNQSTFFEIYTKMKLLIDIFDFTITLLWCPAHVNIPETKKLTSWQRGPQLAPSDALPIQIKH